MEYYDLKDVFKEKPKHKISPPAPIKDFFMPYLLFLGVAFLGLLISLIGMKTWISDIGFFICIISLIGVIFIIPAFRYFIEYLIREKRYYSRLRNDIINTTDYDQFVLIRPQDKDNYLFSFVKHSKKDQEDFNELLSTLSAKKNNNEKNNY
jgi:hypothetical protein